MEKITWEVQIKTVSEANCAENRFRKTERHQQQQLFTRLSFKANVRQMRFPCVITLTRLSSRFLDVDENLPMCFKWIKDELGACIFPEKVVTYLTKSGKVRQNKGHADSDPRIKWVYSQQKSQIQAVRIEIAFTD